ncbi:hypothetical protein ACFOEK_10345 [Litoribrevibacter euphylliae]|uniref:Uncharacterized protein n=1 Tax=Litoribrevibacter euphylliae TaxID=1834034 RepID=A0ABV7HC21_9GAMM
MSEVQRSALPDSALSKHYEAKGAYTDCFFLDVPQKVSFEEYVEAFYTTPLFKLERKILALVVRKPSTDGQAKALAKGERTQFSSWNEEARGENQILMSDFMNKTRSWLKTEDISDDQQTKTRLYFGSVVVPPQTKNGPGEFGFLFHATTGLHVVYSKALLKGAGKRLSKN